MCLIVHKDTEIKIAKEDIIVYKMVKLHNEDYVTPYLSFLYKKDKIYSTSKSLCLSDKKDPGFDRRELIIVSKSLIPKKDLRWIYEGFHFSFTKARLYDCYYIDSRIVKCTIPKGSKYIVGIDKDLGVSDTIILH